jgi:hypothetical protein
MEAFLCPKKDNMFLCLYSLILLGFSFQGATKSQSQKNEPERYACSALYHLARMRESPNSTNRSKAA